jgi:hypothetical protein
MAKFHDWLTELWYGNTLDQWLGAFCFNLSA